MLRRDPLARPEPLIRKVYAYVAYRIGSGPDAEDVTSETFERALRYRDSFDPARGDPLAWLIGIARRCLSDLTPRREEELADDFEASSEGEETASLERIGLGAAMASLSERDRELISLRYGADLTARQIGELLGERTNAIEVALHRALGRLRTSLTREDEARPEPSSLDR